MGNLNDYAGKLKAITAGKFTYAAFTEAVVNELALYADAETHVSDRAAGGMYASLAFAGRRLGFLCVDKESAAADIFAALNFTAAVLSPVTYYAEIRERESVKNALASLTFSELTVAIRVFEVMREEEGIINARKISENIETTGSVIAYALRKLVGAGVIETRSLGAKGTYVKITNSKLREELGKYS